MNMMMYSSITEHLAILVGIHGALGRTRISGRMIFFLVWRS